MVTLCLNEKNLKESKSHPPWSLDFFLEDGTSFGAEKKDEVMLSSGTKPEAFKFLILLIKAINDDDGSSDNEDNNNNNEALFIRDI